MTDPVTPDKRIVVDGKIRHLAVTKIRGFNPAEEGCPMRWWFRDVQGRKEQQRGWHETGNSVDEQVTWYLNTGDNVLGRIARTGQHMLPEPGVDLLLQWGLNDAPRPVDPETKKHKSYFPAEESKVFAAGIPLIGFIDIVNGREQYLVPIDEYGTEVELRSEPGVVEVADVKTASSFRYTKKGVELATDTQMIGYGEFVSKVVPGASHVRLSHNTFTTEPPLKAIKRSILLTMSEVHARWRAVEGVAEQMKSVAAMKRAEDVPGNLSACESFGGCPHKPYCHHYKAQNSLKRIKMGLLKSRTTPAPNGAPPAVANGASNTPWIPPAAPVPPVPGQVSVAPAQTMAIPVPPPQPAASPQGRWIQAKEATQSQKYVVPPTNVLTLYLSSTNGRQSFLPIDGNGEGVGAPIFKGYEEQVYELPFEAPAAPPPVQAAPPPPAPIAPPAPTQVAPPPPPPVVTQVRDQGAPPPPPPLAPPPMTATSTGAPPAAPAAPKRGRRTNAQIAADAAAAAAAQGQAAPVATGLTLCINTIPNGPFIDLATYVAEAAQALQDQFGVLDIRVAANDSPLGFSRWRGLLAQVAKQDPPPPGTYVAFTRGAELTEVVAEALAPLCAPGHLQRGV